MFVAFIILSECIFDLSILTEGLVVVIIELSPEEAATFGIFLSNRYRVVNASPGVLLNLVRGSTAGTASSFTPAFFLSMEAPKALNPWLLLNLGSGWRSVLKLD